MSTPSASVRTKTGRLKRTRRRSHRLCGRQPATGLWVFGVAVLAVFAVGAGYVSLNQIKLRGGRRRGPAIAALAIGDAIATLALFTSLSFIPGGIRQFTM